MHPNDGRVISNFIMQALNNEDITLFGDGKQTRSFQYCDDLVEAMRRYMDLPRRPIDAFVKPEDNIESEIFAAEIYSRLFHYIDNLPPRQRVLIQLAIDGKRNYEIAKEMQISIETVKRQKRNAIDKLRALFKQDEDLLLLLLLNSIVEV